MKLTGHSSEAVQRGYSSLGEQQVVLQDFSFAWDSRIRREIHASARHGCATSKRISLLNQVALAMLAHEDIVTTSVIGPTARTATQPFTSVRPVYSASPKTFLLLMRDRLISRGPSPKSIRVIPDRQNPRTWRIE
jgi:hypothetical protein